MFWIMGSGFFSGEIGYFGTKLSRGKNRRIGNCAPRKLFRGGDLLGEFDWRLRLLKIHDCKKKRTNLKI